MTHREATHLKIGIVLSFDGHIRATAAQQDLARRVRRRRNRMYTECSVLKVQIGGSNLDVKGFAIEIESVLRVS